MEAADDAHGDRICQHTPMRPGAVADVVEVQAHWIHHEQVEQRVEQETCDCRPEIKKGELPRKQAEVEDHDHQIEAW